MRSSMRMSILLVLALSVIGMGVAGQTGQCIVIGDASSLIGEEQFGSSLVLLVASDASLLGRSGVHSSGLFQLGAERADRIAAVFLVGPEEIWSVLIHLNGFEISLAGSQFSPVSDFPSIPSDLATFLIIAGVADNGSRTVDADQLRALAWPSGGDSEGRRITITTPDRSTEWKSGTAERYFWETKHMTHGLSEFFTVEYSTNGGLTWERLAGVSNDGSDPWDIPDEIDSDQCMLRMTSRNYPEVFDTSDIFAIRPERSISITVPISGTVWAADSTQRYYWETSASIAWGLSEFFTVEYSTDGGETWTPFAGVSNDYSDPWSIPDDIDSDQCLLRMTSRNYPEVTATSAMFSIRPLSSVSISTPNIYTSWTAGTTETITWTSQNAGSPFRVEYSTNGGSTWAISSSSTGNDGTEHWSIPSDIDSDQCKIRLTSMQYPTVTATSDAFSIHPAVSRSISVTAPTGSTTWTAGETGSLTWTHENAGTPLKVEYSINGGTSWTTISSSTGNDGTEYWSIPSSIDSDQCRIRLTSMEYPSVTATSAAFTIEPAVDRSISITTPTSSTSWTAGTTETITWTSQNAGSPLRVEYSTNGGSAWTVFSSSTGNDGTEHWPIPSDIASDQCKIRLTSMQYPTVTVTSDAFSIHPAVSRNISITAPTSSTSWTAGTTETITWTSQNAGTPFRVEYSTDGGSTWTIFSSSTGNDGDDHWPIPSDIDSDQCKIRLTSMQYPTVTATSDAFSIHP